MSSEVSFSMAMVSLPVGGTITRIACGSTTRRIALPRLMPRACAASIWPLSTLRMPARAISAMYAASEAASPITPPMRPTKIALASKVAKRQSPDKPEPVDDLPVERHPESQCPL